MPGRRQRDGERVLRLREMSASQPLIGGVNVSHWLTALRAPHSEQREFYGFCVLGMLILRSREDDVMSLLLLQIFESAAWILVTLTCSSLCLLSRIIPLCSPGSLCCDFSLCSALCFCFRTFRALRNLFRRSMTDESSRATLPASQGCLLLLFLNTF